MTAKEVIIIEGDFKIRWEGKMNNIQQPLEYFEIELFYPPMYRVTTFRAKKKNKKQSKWKSGCFMIKMEIEKLYWELRKIEKRRLKRRLKEIEENKK